MLLSQKIQNQRRSQKTILVEMVQITINFSMNETNNLEELLETTTSYFILLNTKVLTIMIC